MLYRVSIKSLGLPFVSLPLLRWPFSVHRQYRVCISREKKKGGERCVCDGGGVRNREDKETAEKNISRI